MMDNAGRYSRGGSKALWIIGDAETITAEEFVRLEAKALA
jgi:hypothetical protein